MKFIEFFHDPVSSFFTLLGAALLSIFGAFIKDGILRIFSNSSKWFKEKREKEQKQIDLVVERLVNSQPYLILYGIKTILSNISIVLIFISLVCIQIFLKITDLNDNLILSLTQNITLTIFGTPARDIFYLMTLLFIIFSAVVGLILIYSVSKRNLIIVRATKMIELSLSSAEAELNEEADSSLSTTPVSEPRDPEYAAARSVVETNQEKALAKTTSEISEQKNEQGGKDIIYRREILVNGKKFIARNGKLFRIAFQKGKSD